MKSQKQKLYSFAELLEKEQIEELHRRGVACEANILNAKVTIKPGKKYIKIDVGPSGKYMVEISTEKIYGIKAYGVIHRGHCYGTLDEIDQWYWGGYSGAKKKPQTKKTEKEVVETIDCTPKWENLAPLFISWLQSGEPGQKKHAREEITRLAVIADTFQEHSKHGGLACKCGETFDIS